MRLVSVLLMLGLITSVSLAAPGGGQEEKPFSYPDGYFADRDTYVEVEPNDTCGVDDQAVVCGDIVDPGCVDPVGDQDWYVFSANEGDEITCGTTYASDPNLPSVDTYIELYADDCATQLTYDDDGGGNMYSLISGFVAPYTGDYHLLVRLLPRTLRLWGTATSTGERHL